MNRSTALAVLAALLVAAPVLAQTGPAVPEMAHYDSALSALFDQHGIPGAAVAVARNGRLVYARGFGLADVEAGTAAEPDARFRIASVQKPITAVAVMKLVEDGLLALDAPAFALLPDLPAPAGQTEDPRLAQITVRDLLQHSGGWDVYQLGYDPMFRAVQIAQAMGVPPPASVETVIRYMRGRPLSFDPGARHAYSNFGYAVLSLIVERVTGQPYEDYVLGLLAETGIHQTALGGSRIEDRLPGEVRYYDFNGAVAPSVFPPHELVPWPYGGYYVEALKGWVSSAPDLLRFMEAVDGRPGRPDILSAQTVQAMTARPALPDWNGTSFWYGFGWLTNTYGNTWHTGGVSGTTAYLIRTAYQNLSYVVLLNTRRIPDGGFFAALDNTLWQAATSTTTWPTHDLFDQFVAGEAVAPGAPTLSLSAPRPNPARGEAALTLTLPEAGAVRAEAFDALGRRVAVLHDGFLAAGPHALRLDASALPAGVYVVRVVGETFTTTARVSVAR